MSHYGVLVIHNEKQNIEELLAPYSENLEIEPYLKYKHDDALKMLRDEGYEDEEIDDALLESFVEEYSSYSLKDGDVYTTYNPNSKWDWYSIGGRFDGELELTDEGIDAAINYSRNPQWLKDLPRNEQVEYVKWSSVAPLKYVKWFVPLSEEEKKEIRRWWEINVDGAELKDGEEKDEYFFWKPEWFKHRYKDANTYIKVKETITFFAVLTPDGEWYAPSNMGWFACTDGKPEDELKWDLNFYDRFIKPNLDSDLICTVVDCHI